MIGKRININDTFRTGIVKYIVKAEYMLTLEWNTKDTPPLPINKIEWCIEFLKSMANWGYNHTYITQRQYELVKDIIKLLKSYKLPKTEAPF
jgi:hypothetical protein